MVEATGIFDVFYVLSQGKRLHVIVAQQDGQCTYKRNSEARSRNHSCREKTINTKYSERGYMLSSMQSACAVLYCHLWPVWPCISPTLHPKRQDFGGGTEYKIHTLIFSSSFV